MKTQLITLYCTVCHHYNNTIAAEVQRQSNNFRPKFTDEECMTAYIFGIAEGKFTVKAVYNFIKEYWHDWFPKLPSYQKFAKRVAFLKSAFSTLYGLLLSDKGNNEYNDVHLLDSMPIIVANAKRSGTAKAASELCNKGYCASKGMYYYGVKLHVLGQAQNKTLPQVRMVQVTSASENDITVAKEWLKNNIWNADLYGDKMYANKSWAEELKLQNVYLHTPIKLKKGQKKLCEADKVFSRSVSSIRQPIESFFAWIQEKTQIQRASKVRSADGLVSFIFARLAFLAFFYW